jgi:hypothetical protein
MLSRFDFSTLSKVQQSVLSIILLASSSASPATVGEEREKFAHGVEPVIVFSYVYGCNKPYFNNAQERGGSLRAPPLRPGNKGGRGEYYHASSIIDAEADAVNVPDSVPNAIRLRLAGLNC